VLTVVQSPRVQSSKARDPRTVELSRRADGSYGALSSDMHTVYTVRPAGDGFTCQCKGYAARQSCCHSIAAERYGYTPVCHSCGGELQDGGVLRPNGRRYCASWDRCHGRISAIRCLAGVR
jgi:hypothetical protein